jgi:hypothetical protein
VLEKPIAVHQLIGSSAHQLISSSVHQFISSQLTSVVCLSSDWIRTFSEKDKFY